MSGNFKSAADPKNRVYDQTIQGNINARNAAMLALDGLKNDLEKDPSVKPERFWEIVAQEAAGKVGKSLSPADDTPAFDYDEAVRFERTFVPWGIHKGKPVREVPLDYWTTITETQFNRDLNRYLRSNRFKFLQEQEEKE